MTKNTVIDDAKSMASTLRSVRMMRPAEAIEKLIEAYLAQEARIAALSKDAERLKFFNQVWRWKALKDGEIILQYGEHVPSLFQKTAELLPTHQPAPKAITAEDVTDEMVKTSVFVNVFNAKQQIANVVNAFNGVKP